ncbi:hypothetical protein Tco_0320461 [Tanacetum coccineum]
MTSHLSAVKRICRKSIQQEVVQFSWRKKTLISWNAKAGTIVATSTTETEYVSAVNCCGQVLWIQNQMLDYGFNFMSTKIYIDNKVPICIVKEICISLQDQSILHWGTHFLRMHMRRTYSGA